MVELLLTLRLDARSLGAGGVGGALGRGRRDRLRDGPVALHPRDRDDLFTARTLRDVQVDARVGDL